MKGTVVDISGRECRLYKDSNAEFLLVQPIDEHDLEVLDQEVEIIKKLSEKPFSLVAFMIKDWNKELTPWPAPPVFGKIPFGNGATDTLNFIVSQAVAFCSRGNTSCNTWRLFPGRTIRTMGILSDRQV